LEHDLYLNINESYLINESLASKFADNVKSKIKSLFNNLYQKLKETSGFEMIISFFEKVVSGLSKFWKFLKKVKAGKILKKLSITLGITSLASYILAQFGAGWAALMGGRMAANILGKKIGDKVVKESFHLKLFEDFLKSKDYKNIHNQNIDKINDFYNRNYKIIDSYYNFIFKNIGNSKPSINGSSESTLRGGGDALPWVQKDLFFRGTSKLSDLYKEFDKKLKQLKTHIKNHKTNGFFEFINWISNHSILKKKEVESNVKFLSETWKNINKNEKSIIDEFEFLVGFKFQASNATNTNNKNNLSLDKTDKKNTSDKTDKKIDDNDSKEDSKEDSNKDIESDDKKTDDKKESKKSIWSKIGGAISTFFKIFRKLKWAIVIFFGVVFILNLIFFPIFDPILQIAQVSSFSMILSDDFEETANTISSIPKVNLEDVEINTDISDNLPSDSEVSENIQGAVNDVKDNIEGNEELAAEEADDIVQRAFVETKSERMDLSEMDKDMDPSKGQSQVQTQVQAQGQEVEQKGGFFKNLKDKAKDVLNITDGDKYVNGLEKSGYQFTNSKIPVMNDINKGVEFEMSETDWISGKSSAAKIGFEEKFLKSDEWNNLPSDVKRKMSSNLSKYIIYKEEGDKYKFNILIPKTDNVED
jgi:hypothetical protein